MPYKYTSGSHLDKCQQRLFLFRARISHLRSAMAERSSKLTYFANEYIFMNRSAMAERKMQTVACLFEDICPRHSL